MTASCSRDFRPSLETAGSATGSEAVSGFVDDGMVGSEFCASDDAASDLGSTADAEPVEGAAADFGSTNGAEAGSAVGAGAGGGIVVEVTDLGAASTLRLTCFSFTIATRLGPKSADPSILEKRALMYSTSRSRLML